MKKFTSLKMMLLAAVMMVGSVSVFGQNTYTLITSDSELVAGSKYLIIGYKASTNEHFALGLQNNNNRASVSVSISANSITATPAVSSTDTNPFEITLGGSNGAWTLYDSVNETFLRPRTGANNGLQGNSNPQNWTISINATGAATMVCENTTTYPRNILRFNATNNPPLFACYANGQTDVYLYKLNESCTNSNILFDVPTINKTTADPSFIQTATSDNGTTAITYSSNDAAVATVNSTTGEVTIVGVGTAIIEANQVAGTHNGVDYCAGNATYTLNVVSTDPTINVSTTALSGFTYNEGSGPSAEQSFTIDALNLTSDLTLTAPANYVISTTSGSGFSGTIVLTPTSGIVSSTTIYVRLTNGLTAGDYTGDITAASTGATDQLVAVSGNVVGLADDEILTFEFAGLAGNEATASSDLNHVNLNSSSISRGAGLTASSNADRFNATNWATGSIDNAVTGDNYMEFTITPNSGYGFTVSSITLNIQRSGTGPSAIALRSSVDSYAANLDQEYAIVDNTSTQTFTFTFAQINSLVPVTYRIYMYSEATGGSGGIGDGVGNDIIVTGTVSPSTSLFSNSLNTDAHAWTSHGKVMLHAAAGEMIEIFNVAGQKIMSRAADDGLNSVDVPVQGVVIVKAGNRVSKVIL